MKKFLESIGGYDERFKYAQDYKLFKDILEKNIKIKSLNKTLYKLNNNNNISSKFLKSKNIILIVQDTISILNFVLSFYTPYNHLLK